MNRDPLVRMLDPLAMRRQMARRGPPAVAAHPLWQEARLRLEDRLSYIRIESGDRLDHGIAQYGQPVNPAAASLRMIWSVGLPAYLSDLRATLAFWARSLAPGGLLMFVSLGPDSLRSLALALGDTDQHRHVAGYPDMHDIGDALVGLGMSNPVMDAEWIDLTYTSPEAALSDLRCLGGNALLGRPDGLRGRRWRQQVLAALASLSSGNVIRLRMELVFGHAWAAVPRQTGVSGQSPSVQPVIWAGKVPKDSSSGI
jgi:hypothetical protein